MTGKYSGVYWKSLMNELNDFLSRFYTPQDYPITFDFLKRAKGIGLPVEELVTHHFKLEDIDEAFKTNLAMTGIKVAVVCD